MEGQKPLTFDLKYLCVSTLGVSDEFFLIFGSTNPLTCFNVLKTHVKCFSHILYIIATLLFPDCLKRADFYKGLAFHYSQ